jgi:hypothetical protein
MAEDYFRARLDQMIDLQHPLALLAKRLPWDAIEARITPLLPEFDTKSKKSLIFGYRLHINQQLRGLFKIFL